MMAEIIIATSSVQRNKNQQQNLFCVAVRCGQIVVQITQKNLKLLLNLAGVLRCLTFRLHLLQRFDRILVKTPDICKH